MLFRYPSFLFALFAVLLPILIHLFNLRAYKKEYFSNIEFLKNIEQQNKSRTKLKNLLLLLLRILAIAALVFVFADPYIPKDQKQTKSESIEKRVAIYMDNSFSVQGNNQYGKIFDLERQKALEIIDAYPPQTPFLIVTNDFENDPPTPLYREQALEAVRSVHISPHIKSLHELMQHLKEFEEDEEKYQTIFYILSDFRKSTAGLEQVETGDKNQMIWVPILAEETGNIHIDSAWFESPHRTVFQEDKLFVKLTNNSGEDYPELPVSLYLNDRLKATVSPALAPHSSVVQEITFHNKAKGIVNGRLEISDYPITYDNYLYFNYPVEENSKSLIISKKKNKYIEAVFDLHQDIAFDYAQNIRQKKIGLSKYNSLIFMDVDDLNNETSSTLANYVSEGGKLIIFPQLSTNFTSCNALLNKLQMRLLAGVDTSKTYAENINYEAKVWFSVFKKKAQNYDMPYFLKHLKFAPGGHINEEVLIDSEKGDPLVIAASYGKGKVYLFAANPEKEIGNFVFHPLWSSLIYNILIFKTLEENIYYTLGAENAVEIRNPDTLNNEIPAHLQAWNKPEPNFIPQSFKSSGGRQTLFFNSRIQKAGHYKITLNEKTLRGISFNYNRLESDLASYAIDDLKKIAHEKNIKILSGNLQTDVFQNKIKDTATGRSLRRFFIVLVLLLLFAEIFLLRKNKNR